jgi:hypothetical protein
MPLKLSLTQIAFNARGDGKFNKPFPEQVDFFREKLNLPSEHYDDILQSAHDRAFIVAGAAKADLLDDLRGAIDKAVAGDIAFSQWKRQFQQIVQKHGWEGWTGSDTQEGRDWRARVIYQTNMATSYAAGRYAQMEHPDVVKRRPYLKYVHSDNVLHPRPLHESWHGLVLHRDDPWWIAHRPPNGYGCQCTVDAVTAAEYEGASAPDDGVWVKEDRTGQRHVIPNGIDYGFDYTPGAKRHAPLQAMIDQKLIRMPASIGAEMWQALKPILLEEQTHAVGAMVATAAASMQPAGHGVIAHVIEPATVSALAEQGVALDNASVWLRDRELIHALRDAKIEHGGALPLKVWQNLPMYLQTAVPYLDTQDQAVLYVFELPGVAGKVVIRLNRVEKISGAGRREKVLANFIVTGGVIRAENLSGDRYLPLGKP